MRTSLAAALLFAIASMSALAADPAERKFVYAGMSEADVLIKIGKPDSESIDSGGGATVTVKRWIYLPTAGDPQTVTTITISEGKVIEVSRQVTR